MSEAELSVLKVCLINVFYAILCGGAIGVEREIKKKRAGLKTNLLICIGSTLVTTFSLLATREYGEQVRIIAQIVSGVGFLGAGAIIRSPDDRVSGLTTASLIWMVSALGIGIGMGHGFTCTVMALLVVAVVHLVTLFERHVIWKDKLREKN